MVDFEYDKWDNLVSGTYNTANEIKTIYKTLYTVEGRTLRNSPVDYFSDGARRRARENESAKQDDRVYDKGGKLLKDELHYYYYDAKGNLVFKEYKKTEHPSVVDKKEIQDRFKIKLSGSGIGYQYI